MSEEEREKLIAVWEAASDYCMGLKNQGFAADHGGQELLFKILEDAISSYESE